ncbi:rhomboid family intramembrane serine protease [Hydrogenophaga sp. RWCD_12]|uniref:rhomboid family intramembrane serine protease n=1 Tax=Hydrogenophaga sp. RWCD_12 TaxID=3391190 RepID=UPI003984AE71
MFFAIPLANKPTWKSPPWMTVLLIVINMAIYWGWQASEDQKVERNAERYAASGLAAIEVPRYIEHLRRAPSTDARSKEHVEAIEKHWAKNDEQQLAEQLYVDMWHEQNFRQALLAGQVITKSDPQYEQWRSLRSQVTPYEPQPFTWRWALHFDHGLTDPSANWLTATFLHGSTEHLLGNMVFLFLFGFTLEMALGAGVYLAMYLLSGVGASMASLWSHAGDPGMGLGASGAISGLMAMYVVMYRLRRVNFFYLLLFYFNYARWPALVMLPVYMGHELLQQWLGNDGVDYMAHLGGLTCGAVLMALLMSVKKLEAPSNMAPVEAAPASEDEAAAQAAIDRAQALTDGLDFAAASQAWHRAARLRPRDEAVLAPWFDVAKHFPSSDEFHAAAKGLLTLPAADSAARRRQHTRYHEYLKLAKPGARLSGGTLVHLVVSFVKLQAWDDAQHLARVLHRSSPVHPQWPATLTLLVNQLVHHKQFEAAMGWLPALMVHAPEDPVTRMLARRDPPAAP